MVDENKISSCNGKHHAKIVPVTRKKTVRKNGVSPFLQMVAVRIYSTILFLIDINVEWEQVLVEKWKLLLHGNN